MCNTPNNVCQSRSSDYFRNSVVQVPFYKDATGFLHFAAALDSSYWVHDSNKHPVHLYKPERLFCILYLDAWLSLLWHSPFTLSMPFCAIPTVPALPSHGIICKFNKHPSPLPKLNPVYSDFYMKAG